MFIHETNFVFPTHENLHRFRNLALGQRIEGEERRGGGRGGRRKGERGKETKKERGREGAA